MKISFALGFSVAIIGCKANLKFDEKRIITCASSADCPANTVCREAVGRCVGVGDVSEAPAIVGAATVTPTFGSANTTFSVTFDVSHALSQDPTVSVDLHTTTVNLQRDASQSTATHFVYTYTSTGTEPEGLGTVYVDLVDNAGNEAKGLPGGIFRIDYTPPALVGGAALARNDNLPSAVTNDGLLLSRASPYGGATPPSALISFVVDEALAVAPIVQAGPTVATLLSARGEAYTFALQASGSEPEGPAPVTAQVQDAAGNVATLTLGMLIYDFSPPATFDSTRLVYSRNPSEALYQISGDVGAAPANGRVRVYRNLTQGYADVAAEVVAAADGSVASTAAPGDLSTIYVSILDEAGNENLAAPVKRIRWEATFNTKVTGDFSSNPHSAFAIDAAQQVPRQADVRYELLSDEYCELQPSPPPDCALVFRGAVWKQRPLLVPPRNTHPLVVFDTLRGRMVVVGGSANTNPLGDTWAWTGEDWQNISPPDGTPGPHADGGVVYDSARDRIVLFGGLSRGTSSPPFPVLSDTWEWDNHTWHKRTPAHAPPPRHFPLMVYDAFAGVTLLFGGQDANNSMLKDTWLWDGNDWTQGADFPNASATAFNVSHLVYDTNRHVSVFYDNATQTTWEWAGSAWVQALAPTTRTATGSTVMVYDSARHVTVITDFDTNWERTTGAWTAVAQSPTLVSAMGSTSSIVAPYFDSSRGVTMIYDGFGMGELSGAAWQQIWKWQTAAGPSARQAAGMAYDSLRGRTVLFGGNTSNLSTANDETWEWNGRGWATALPATRPTPRWGYGIAYDTERSVTVLVGGANGTGGFAGANETWTWNGSTWTDHAQGTAPGFAPSARSYPTLTFSTVSKLALLFGGTRSDGAMMADTYEWDGAAWATRAPTHVPPARTWATMGYDSVADASVLYGGYNFTTSTAPPPDVWRWFGGDWHQSVVAPNPGVVAGQAMAFDTFRDRTVLFGVGLGSSDSLTSELGANTWGSTLAFPSAPGRGFNAVAYDSKRRALVMWGGFNGQILVNDLWEYRDVGSPGVEAVFALPDDLRVKQGKRAAANVLSVGVEASGGGSGGVLAEIWDRLGNDTGAFRTVAQNAAPPSAPAALSGSLVAMTPSDLDGVVAGESTLIRLRPVDTTPDPAARIRASALRCTIVYQLP